MFWFDILSNFCQGDYLAAVTSSTRRTLLAHGRWAPTATSSNSGAPEASP